MKVVVLGGSGFIGSNLIMSLIDSGFDVVVCDRSKPKFIELSANVEFIPFDLTQNQDWSKILPQVDVLIHLASSSYPSISNKNIPEDVKTNLLTNLELLEAIRTYNPDIKLIYFSSGGAIYGSGVGNMLQEDDRLHPQSSYGIVKITTEYYLDLYRQLHGLNYVVLRPSNPFGPQQNFKKQHGLINQLIYRILNDDVVTIIGDGSSVRDYIYISDLCDCVIGVLKNFNTGTYHVSSGHGLSVTEVVEKVERVMGREARKDYVNARKSDVDYVVLSNNKTTSTFNWSPTVSLEDGIYLHWKWMESLLNKNSKKTK